MNDQPQEMLHSASTAADNRRPTPHRSFCSRVDSHSLVVSSGLRSLKVSYYKPKSHSKLGGISSCAHLSTFSL